MGSPNDDGGTLLGNGFFRGRPLGLEAKPFAAAAEDVRFKDHKCGFNTTDLALFSGSILIMFLGLL